MHFLAGRSAFLGRGRRSLRHALHLCDRLAHLIDPLRLLTTGLADFADELPELHERGGDRADGRGDEIHFAGAVAGARDALLDQGGRVAGGLRGPLRQTANLVGDHGKPIPASPALAASTAAFNASRFVWNAISSIVLMIFETLRLASTMPLIEATMAFSASFEAFTCWLTSAIRSAARAECTAVRWVIEDISSMEADVWTSAADCSLAPFERLCDEADTSFAADTTWAAP
jgi:hypothetical protein